jgi:hypothetical protein
MVLGLLIILTHWKTCFRPPLAVFISSLCVSSQKLLSWVCVCLGRWGDARGDVRLHLIDFNISHSNPIVFYSIDVNLSLLKRTASSVRSQTTSEIPTPGSKTLRHTLTGHQSSGHKPSENNDNQRGHRVVIESILYF